MCICKVTTLNSNMLLASMHYSRTVSLFRQLFLGKYRRFESTIQKGSPLLDCLLKKIHYALVLYLPEFSSLLKKLHLKSNDIRKGLT